MIIEKIRQALDSSLKEGTKIIVIQSMIREYWEGEAELTEDDIAWTEDLIRALSQQMSDLKKRIE